MTLMRLMPYYFSMIKLYWVFSDYRKHNKRVFRPNLEIRISFEKLRYAHDLEI